MSLQIASLNSGSNGNCYYVGSHEDAVLIDVGISCREVEKRMSRSGLSLKKLRAVFISHEHSDHIKGLEVFVRKHGIPVFISEGTHRRTWVDLSGVSISYFTDEARVKIGSLDVRSFRKHHDAADPYSFVVSSNDTHVGVFTDIGRPCAGLEKHFSMCHAVFLEANYDSEMLQAGNYPFHLKRRISGGKGHLSNEQALKLFIEKRNPALSHLVLSHLSQENNCPILVNDLFKKHAGQTKVVVASRHQESEVFNIQKAGVGERNELQVRQLALF